MGSLYVRSGTRDGVAHHATVAETIGEEAGRVDTVVLFDQLNHIVHEL